MPYPLSKLKRALLLTLIIATPAWAQSNVDGILKSVSGGWASGKLKDGTIVKVSSTGNRNAPLDVAPKLAIYKIALLARSAGYQRFAVRKQSCGTLMISNIPVNHSCKAEAQLLREGEEALPRGKNKVSYYEVDPVIASIEAGVSQLMNY